MAFSFYPTAIHKCSGDEYDLVPAAFISIEKTNDRSPVSGFFQPLDRLNSIQLFKPFYQLVQFFLIVYINFDQPLK
ncbi:hypothetical protein SAMN04488122_1584 [Chitinophaga arvensicola]|uniref:Uncharacterized protein n=1 Tax=Chitinophaga arvensicola TaxID=29529 RepID=A0A1I0QN95_9BACT|nr:hypothetical protein SAMN04488122_1584 [Chitinophaga arvensicola]